MLVCQSLGCTSCADTRSKRGIVVMVCDTSPWFLSCFPLSFCLPGPRPVFSNSEFKSLSVGLVSETPLGHPYPHGYLSLYLASMGVLTPSNALTNLTIECYYLLLVPSSPIFGICGRRDMDINAMRIKHENLLMYGREWRYDYMITRHEYADCSTEWKMFLEQVVGWF